MWVICTYPRYIGGKLCRYLALNFFVIEIRAKKETWRISGVMSANGDTVDCTDCEHEMHIFAFSVATNEVFLQLNIFSNY